MDQPVGQAQNKPTSETRSSVSPVTELTDGDTHNESRLEEDTVDVFRATSTNSSIYYHRYYAAYTSLLRELFPDKKYVISTHFRPHPTTDETDELTTAAGSQMEFTVGVIVKNDVRPLLFVEVRDDFHLLYQDRRHEADQLMRRRIKRLAPISPITHFYGVSFMGTKMRVYSVEVKKGATIFPRYIPYPPPQQDPNVVTFGYLDDAWNPDVLSREGRVRMTQICGTTDRMLKEFLTRMKKVEMKKREQRMKRRLSAAVSNADGSLSV